MCASTTERGPKSITRELVRSNGWKGCQKMMAYHELLELLEQTVVQCDCLFDRLDDEIVCGWVVGSYHGGGIE
jgi:hypothetical protein